MPSAISLGMDKDREIAKEIDKVNVIIGGHFHILMDKPEIVNNTIIHYFWMLWRKFRFIKNSGS